MATTKTTAGAQDKSAQPETMENKSLEPKAAEDKSAEQKDDGLVAVSIARHVRAGVVGNDKELRPGDKARVTRQHAILLVRDGAATYA